MYAIDLVFWKISPLMYWAERRLSTDAYSGYFLESERLCLGTPRKWQILW